jgi:hypothetical protein
MSLINFIRLVSPNGETWEHYARQKWGVRVTRWHGWLDGTREKAWTRVLSRPDATLRWKALKNKGWRETVRRNPPILDATQIQFVVLDSRAKRFVLRRKKHRIAAARPSGGWVYVWKQLSPNHKAKSRWHDHEVFLPGIDTRADLKRKKAAARKYLTTVRKALLG